MLMDVAPMKAFLHQANRLTNRIDLIELLEQNLLALFQLDRG